MKPAPMNPILRDPLLPFAVMIVLASKRLLQPA